MAGRLQAHICTRASSMGGVGLMDAICPGLLHSGSPPNAWLLGVRRGPESQNPS